MTPWPAGRPATQVDVAAVAALEAELFGPDAWSAATVERTLACDLVLVTGDRSGYIAVSVAGDVADLQRIGVASTRRRAGVARALFAKATDAARRAGADRMLVEVGADNSVALAFYDALGFAEVNRRRRYYRDGADAIVMELALVEGR